MSRNSGGTRRGAYVDSKGVRWDPNDADYEGILYKQSKWMKEWRSRYFILKGSKLFYAKNSTHSPHGIIDLVDCIAVKGAIDEKTKKNYSFEIITTDETLLMYANSLKEKDEWISAIGKAILKHSSMVNDQEYLDSEGDESGDDENSQNIPEMRG